MQVSLGRLKLTDHQSVSSLSGTELTEVLESHQGNGVFIPSHPSGGCETGHLVIAGGSNLQAVRQSGCGNPIQQIVDHLRVNIH
jgi:hypothetical protein